MHLRFYGILMITCLFFTMGGCSSDKDKNSQDKPPVSLVKVNESLITSDDLSFAKQRLLSGVAVTEEMSNRLLESLVASRAMATLAEQQLSQEAKQRLLADVENYKEERLVKFYINNSAEPEPVSQELVKKYYRDNPKEFGADTIAGFEYIESYSELEVSKLSLLRGLLTKVTPAQNIREYAALLQQQGYPVRYKQATLRYGLLQAPLDNLVKNTEQGELAPLYDQRVLILLKVISKKQIPPKPLLEVSADIRKKLAPIQFKKAIKRLSNKARENSTIEYLNKQSTN